MSWAFILRNFSVFRDFLNGYSGHNIHVILITRLLLTGFCWWNKFLIFIFAWFWLRRSTVLPIFQVLNVWTPCPFIFLSANWPILYQAHLFFVKSCETDNSNQHMLPNFYSLLFRTINSLSSLPACQVITGDNITECFATGWYGQLSLQLLITASCMYAAWHLSQCHMFSFCCCDSTPCLATNFRITSIWWVVLQSKPAPVKVYFSHCDHWGTKAGSIYLEKHFYDCCGGKKGRLQAIL